MGNSIFPVFECISVTYIYSMRNWMYRFSVQISYLHNNKYPSSAQATLFMRWLAGAVCWARYASWASMGSLLWTNFF